MRRSIVKQLQMVALQRCNGDGLCTEVCPQKAIELVNEVASMAEPIPASPADTGNLMETS